MGIVTPKRPLYPVSKMMSNNEVYFTVLRQRPRSPCLHIGMNWRAIGCWWNRKQGIVRWNEQWSRCGIFSRRERPRSLRARVFCVVTHCATVYVLC